MFLVRAVDEKLVLMRECFVPVKCPAPRVCLRVAGVCPIFLKTVSLDVWQLFRCCWPELNFCRQHCLFRAGPLSCVTARRSPRQLRQRATPTKHLPIFTAGNLELLSFWGRRSLRASLVLLFWALEQLVGRLFFST